MYGKPFEPLDVERLPHYSADDLRVLTAPDRVIDLVNRNDSGTDLLLEDIYRPRRRSMSRQVRRLIVLPAVLAALGLGLAGQVATAPTAQAATQPVKGPGLSLKAEGRTVHEGAYRYGTRLLYCTDWGLQIGDGDVRKGVGAPKLDPETRARVNLVVNTWGSTSDNRQAARVKLALDTLIAPKDARLARALPGMLAQVTAADRAAVTGMVTESATHAPYRVSKALTGAVPGQKGSAVVTVLGSNGKPATGRTVVYRLTGATVTGGTVKTDTKGRAVLAFTAAGLGQTMTADVTSPSSTAVWQNAPTKGHQLMVGGGFTDQVRVSDAAELCPITLQMSKTCDCTKTGVRNASFTFTADPMPGLYVAVVRVNGTPVKSAELTAGESVTLTVPTRAGDEVEASYSITDAAGHELWREVLDTYTQGGGR